MKQKTFRFSEEEIHLLLLCLSSFNECKRETTLLIFRIAQQLASQPAKK